MPLSIGIGIGIGNSFSLGQGSSGIAPYAFPAPGSIRHMDFAGQQFNGITQPKTNNTADGRGFTQQITPTVPSFAPKGDGSLERFSASTVRYTAGLGAIIDGDRTDRTLQDSDLTNASWVATGATMTKNQPDRAGIANAATRVTLTATTATFVQSRTIVVLSYLMKLDAKPNAGITLVEWSYDGVEFFTLDTSKVLNNGWSRPGAPERSITNPVFTLRITGTIGGTIDFAHINAVADTGVTGLMEYGPCPVSTTTGLKAWRDRPSAMTGDASPIAAYISTASVRCIFLRWSQRTSGGLLISDIGDVANCGSAVQGATAFGSSPQTANKPNFQTDYHTPVWNKGFFWQTPTETGCCLNGGTIVRNSGAAPVAIDHVDLGTNGAGSRSINGFIAEYVDFLAVPSDDTIKAWTA